MSTLQQVHVRVNDAATGKPTPCRVRFTDAEGKYFAPFGRLTEFATGPGTDVGGSVQVSRLNSEGKILPEQFAYIDGSCEILLPAGIVHVTICKGPEFLPIHPQIHLAAGKLALRFELERWSDLRQQGWYPGDSRAHFLSPRAALLDGAGEDLAVVNVLARMTMVKDSDDWMESTKLAAAISNLIEFSGQQPALERDGCMVVVNTHNTHPRLGSLGLLNCHRVVYPLCFGGPPFGDPYENWTLADWCDQCHRKNGLVVWTGTDVENTGHEYGERLADLILQKIDAVEVTRFNWENPHPWRFDWYQLLNGGFRLPLVGASAKDSNYLPLGTVRTYARLQPQQPLTYQNWIEAVRAGRTFVTNGPLLRFTVDGQDPGATIQFGADQTVRVEAEARSVTPFERLEIIVSGRVALQQPADGYPATARIATEIRVPDGGWIAARCWGKSWLPGYCAGQRIYAHTSPVYLRVDGRHPPVDAATTQGFLDHLARMLIWVDEHGRFENAGQRQRLRKVFEDAIAVLHKRHA